MEPSCLFDLDGLFQIFTSSDDLDDNDDYIAEISRSFIDHISIMPLDPEVSDSIYSQSIDSSSEHALAEENVSPVSPAASELPDLNTTNHNQNLQEDEISITNL
ncbi:hypothetical protein L1987_09228 [Smallanthus sonchifolius]|uniref:Uncharacterized protein n=1 Tax=Smallanthus sonchifolius TaxID=185202 RepID=A0ACB9JNC8_9ASTR|nr:hypothetical protein L1987_09228 [Smallanthus sonchifolius]